jgi:MarR family transcriptional regulator for hemolysin
MSELIKVNSSPAVVGSEGQPSLAFLLHDVARLQRKRFDQRARNAGLTRSQWQTIACLSKNEGINQAGLAELLEIEPITVVRTLDRLAERGLVERRQHPTDRRIWRLFLKEAARPLIEAMQRIGEATRAETFEGVSESERGLLVESLIRMKSNLTTACRAPAEMKETHYG